MESLSDAVKIFTPAFVAFVIGMGITPLITHFLYKWKLWKKQSVPKSIDGRPAPISQKIHGDEKRHVPRMGGIIVWLSVFLTIGVSLLAVLIFPTVHTEKLVFLSRGQTWLPAFTLLVGGIFGLLDDWAVVNDKGGATGGGMSLKERLFFITLLALLGGIWFYLKLDVNSIHIPFDGELILGWLFVPLFIIVMLALYSGGIIDGVDGLAGGVFTVMFLSYGVIAYSQQQIDLAAFSMVIAGGLLVFLWFNIPPARFYLSETGTMALTTTLTVIAFLTGEVLVLPIIALPLVLTTGSVLLQLGSKKLRNGKKVFIVAPLHNHFIAKGWPRHKVTMRYWVFSVMCGVLGIVLALVS